MNQWSSKRKLVVSLIVLFAAIVLIVIPGYFLFYKAPTCFDGKQNGDETGFDCGGSCQLLCNAESLPIVSEGDPRILLVSLSTPTYVYELAALFRNPNPTGEIYKASYVFKIFSSGSSDPVKVIEGETYVPPNSTFAIFEGPFNLENTGNLRVTFDWKDETLVWQKRKDALPKIVVSNQTLSNEESQPRLEATVKNESLSRIKNIEITALVSDESGNLFAASQTFVDSLASGATTPIVFVWPEAFYKPAVKIDLIPRVLPDKSFIK